MISRFSVLANEEPGDSRGGLCIEHLLTNTRDIFWEVLALTYLGSQSGERFKGRC